MNKKLLNHTEVFLTPEEIWDLVNRQNEYASKNYRPHKHYFDYRQVIWGKVREKAAKRLKRKWPPSDWKTDDETGEKIKPKKPNFLDETIKWSKSYCDIAKAKEIKEDLENRGHPINEKPKKKIYANLRKRFLNQEREKKEHKKNLPVLPEWKVEGVEKIKEKIKESALNKVTKKLERPFFGQCDRITNVSEAIYMGESVPFYNTFISKKDDPKKIDLFYPKKIYMWKRSPAWKLMEKSNSFNDKTKVRDERIEEKTQSYFEKNNDGKPFILNVSNSFEKVNNRHILLTMAKKFDYENTEQYKSAREQHPEFSPSPQHYWKTPVGYLTFNIKKPKVDEEDIDESKKFIPRDKSERRVYKPMNKTIF